MDHEGDETMGTSIKTTETKGHAAQAAETDRLQPMEPSGSSKGSRQPGPLQAQAKKQRRTPEAGEDSGVSTAVERRPIPPMAPRNGLRQRVGKALQGPQFALQTPVSRWEADAVPSHYGQSKEIQALGHRVEMKRAPQRRPDEAERAAAAIADGREFSAAQLAAPEQAVARKFPDIGADPARLNIAAMALASASPDDGADALFDAMARIDFARLRAGELDGVGQGVRTPISRAVELLMTLSRSGSVGADIASAMVRATQAPAQAPDAATLAAMAAEPVNIEMRPAAIGKIQAELNRILDGLSPQPAAEHRLTDGERQITALAVHQACGAEASAALKALTSHDLSGALMGHAEAADVDVAVQKTLRTMVLAGGAAALAARKMVNASGNSTMSLADLRVISSAFKELAGPGVESLQQAVTEAARIQAAVDSPGGLSAGTELRPIAPRGDAARAAALEAGGAIRGLGAAWPSPQTLRAQGVPVDDVAKRLPALALTGMVRKLKGEEPTKPQKAAMSAVRSGIVSEEGKLDFANRQCRNLGQWLQPSAGANVLNRLLGNRFATDPVAPLVQHGPLGSLNNIAVPQLGMKESLGPLTDLMTMVASAQAADGSTEKSDRQLQTDFGKVALLQHWGRQTQGMLGKEVTIRAEQLGSIGAQAARLAGKTGEAADAFAAAVRGQLGGERLDQAAMRALYEEVVRRSLQLKSASSPEQALLIENRLQALDDAMIRATGSPSDFDNHYANEVPAYGRGAMQSGSAARNARNNDRIGALADIMEAFGTSSGLNMASYGGAYMPDQGTLITTGLKIARHPAFTAHVSPSVIAGYQGGWTGESIVRMGVNASGIEFNFGEGATSTHGLALGGGLAVNTHQIAGQKQRVGFTLGGSYGTTKSAYQSVFLRVPRTSEANGGVPGAGAGSSSDKLRTAYLARAMRRLGELLNGREPNPLLSLMAEFDALSLGVANGDNDFTDTVLSEWSARGGVTAGIGSVGGEKWSLPGQAALSGRVSYTPDRTLDIKTHGSVNASRHQEFSQWKSEVNGGAQLGGRPSPATINASYVPHATNSPTSMSYMRTEIDGVLDQAGTYLSFETESLAHMLKHFEEHGPTYAAGMVSFREDLAKIRDDKLAVFRDEASRSDAEIAAKAQELLDDDIHAQMEDLKGMILTRESKPGLSYRGTAEISVPAHIKANEQLAVAELAKLSPQTEPLAQVRERELARHLKSLDSYVHNDVGFRMNTYDKSEFNLAGVLYSGWKMDARTNADRAKI